jgi:transposase
MNRLELVGESMRRALNDLAQKEPEWLKKHMLPEWIERYGRRFDLYRLPKGEREQRELAETIGNDGLKLLLAMSTQETSEAVSQAPSVKMLRQIWLQQFYWVADEQGVHWRTKKEWGVPPAHQMIASPDEADARYGGKGSTYWTGYKVHITETCQPEEPHLITHVETTPATTHDSQVTEKVQDDLAAKDLMPEEHLIDSGYVDTNNILSGRKKGIDVIGPVQEDHSWQARAENGFDKLHFQIDWEQMQATCPNGKTSSHVKKGYSRSNEITYRFSFATRDCAACQLRDQCTQSKTRGREVAVFPPDKLQILIEMRQRQKTEAFKKRYQLRSGIEGTISQAVNRFGQRKAHYRGLAKTHLQSLATAAAINFVRLSDWLVDRRPEKTRISPLVTLSLQS